MGNIVNRTVLGQVLHFNISLSKQAFGLHYASVSRIVSESGRFAE